MKAYYFILLAWVLFPKGTYALQSNNWNKNFPDTSEVNPVKSFFSLYKANRELSYTSPKGELGSPVKFVLIGKLTTSYFLFATKTSRLAFALIPEFTVKVIDERSAGVRTPSLKLGGMLYYQINNEPNNYHYASLRFTHHSNGQDGEAINPDGSINTRTGNFSTNFLTTTYHFGKSKSSAHGELYQLNYAVGLEWHRWFDYEKALEKDYGFTRINYSFSMKEYSDTHENWRLNGELSFAVNKMAEYKIFEAKKRLNIESSFHYSFPFMSKAFIMAAVGYYGEDPYNIYYRDKYSYLRFGVSSAL